MRHPPVDVAILLPSSYFFPMFALLYSLLLPGASPGLFAAEMDHTLQSENFSEPASIRRYAEITPQNEEAVVDLLNRVSQYAESGDLFDDPIVIMLHGPDARVFDRSNYNMYRSVVELARQLDNQGVIEMKICQVWMSRNGVDAEEIPDFIDSVPYGPAVIDKMVESGSVAF